MIASARNARSSDGSPQTISDSSPRPQGRDSTKRDRAVERQRSKIDAASVEHLQNVSDSIIAISKHLAECVAPLRSFVQVSENDSKMRAILGHIKLLSPKDVKRKALLEALEAFEANEKPNV